MTERVTLETCYVCLFRFSFFVFVQFNTSKTYMRKHILHVSCNSKRAFFLSVWSCYCSADDCPSCDQREFKVHELVNKACQEFDFGKKRLIIMMHLYSQRVKIVNSRAVFYKNKNTKRQN